jgi:hypothetical protein
VLHVLPLDGFLVATMPIHCCLPLLLLNQQCPDGTDIQCWGTTTRIAHNMKLHACWSHSLQECVEGTAQRPGPKPLPWHNPADRSGTVIGHLLDLHACHVDAMLMLIR